VFSVFGWVEPIPSTDGVFGTQKDRIFMFAEPQSVTVSGSAKSLPRVQFGDRNGTFESVAAGLVLKLSHLIGKRNRRTVRLDSTKTSADPFQTDVNRQYSMSAYLVIDHPPVGFTAAETEANAKALIDWLAVAGNLTKVVGGES
jgi:hypothetical protein